MTVTWHRCAAATRLVPFASVPLRVCVTTHMAPPASTLENLPILVPFAVAISWPFSGVRAPGCTGMLTVCLCPSTVEPLGVARTRPCVPRLQAALIASVSAFVSVAVPRLPIAAASRLNFGPGSMVLSTIAIMSPAVGLPPSVWSGHASIPLPLICVGATQATVIPLCSASSFLSSVLGSAPGLVSSAGSVVELRVASVGVCRIIWMSCHSSSLFGVCSIVLATGRLAAPPSHIRARSHFRSVAVLSSSSSCLCSTNHSSLSVVKGLDVAQAHAGSVFPMLTLSCPVAASRMRALRSYLLPGAEHACPRAW